MSNISYKKAALAAGALIAVAATSVVSATPTPTSIAAIAVRVQNYPSGGTALWFTGSPCANGGMVLDPTDTLDRHKALYATVLAAKAMNAKLFIEYDLGSVEGVPICVIRTFGVDAG